MTIQASLSSQLHVMTLNVPDNTDIVDLFAPFADTPWSMLLDSSHSQHVDGRFEIFVAEPLATCTSKNGVTRIWHQHSDKTETSLADPIATIHQLQQQYFAAATQDNTYSDLPFKAGLMGAFGYDLGRQFESLPSIASETSEAPDMAIGVYGWSVIKDRQQNIFYLCHLDSVQPPLIKASSVENTASFKLSSDWKANMDQQQYSQSIHRIHEYLKAGDCYQVNFAQKFSATFEGSPWHAYQALREANKAPFSAFIQLPEHTFMSISPERFLSVKEGKVQTKPIKGTMPRSTDTDIDASNREVLLSSEKDRAENLMIVDLLRNDLSRSCRPGSVDVPELFAIESFEAVHHLVSTVVGELEVNHSPLTLLENAFPGGSITGAPKIRAMEIIEELEPDTRNIYCGSIGYLGINNDMDTSICIRTLLCDKDQIHCWAGGGIVLDSDADAEYRETLAKVSKILPVLSELS